LAGASTLGRAANAADEVKITRNVPYGEVAGEELLLDVYEPAGEATAKRPAVLLIHGGGWMHGDRTAPSMIAMGKALARAGFVAFSVEYRLVKKAPDSTEWTNQYPAAIDDCREAVRWVRANAEKYRVDPAKLGAYGESAGGHLVAMLGTSDAADGAGQPSSGVQAVVDVFGPADLTGDYTKLKVGAVVVQDLVDAFASTPEHKAEASPIKHIDDQTAAFLIFHGADDPIVPVQQSRDFHAALEKANRTTEYVEFAGAGHGFGGANAATMTARTIAFFNRELKGEPGAIAAPAPAAEAPAEEPPAPVKTAEPAPAPAPDLGAMFRMHYTNRVRAFQEQCEQLQYVVLLGDSITEGFSVPKFFPGHRVLNRGIGADVIGNGLPAEDNRGVLRRLDESVFNCAATDVFLLIGINDMGSGRTPEDMEPGYREILERIKRETPRVRVHVQSVLPTRGRFAKHNAPVLEFNERLKKLAAEFGYDYLDLHAKMTDDKGELKAEYTGDGLHLNAAAYEVWKAEVERVMGW
jgi:acetyl esterase/lipase/lysophospholipase L1-like esterase